MLGFFGQYVYVNQDMDMSFAIFSHNPKFAEHQALLITAINNMYCYWDNKYSKIPGLCDSA